MKDGRKPEYPEKTPGDGLQKISSQTSKSKASVKGILYKMIKVRFSPLDIEHAK